MTDVFFDPPRSDEAWRKMIYEGDIIIQSSTPEMLALVEHARSMIEDTCARELGRRTMRRDPHGTKAQLHPRPAYEGTHKGRAECLWLLAR